MTGDKLADVEYVLDATVPRASTGRIFIGDDPHPAARFMTERHRGVPDHYVLHTTAGDRLEILFLNSNGTFDPV